MRSLLLAVVVACGLSAALADEKELAPPVIHLEFHEAIRSQYRFVAHPMPELAPPPAWSMHASLVDLPPPASDGIPVDPEVVRMAPVIVHGDAVFRQIDAALKAQDIQIKDRQMYARLGIRVHELRLGKLHFGVLTELGVPVMIGIAW